MIKQGCSDKQIVQKFIEQLKEKDLLLAEKTEKMDEIVKSTGLDRSEAAILGREISIIRTPRSLSGTQNLFGKMGQRNGRNESMD